VELKKELYQDLYRLLNQEKVLFHCSITQLNNISVVVIENNLDFLDFSDIFCNLLVYTFGP